MAEACRLAEGNPGLELGLALGEGWRDGRDKICIEPSAGGFGLWVEQLLAESTGKQGKGLVPAPGESADGPDRQAQEVRVPAPYELGQEFFRWEFATAVAGSILGINPFDQPDVQAAKDKTSEVLAAGDEPDVEPRGLGRGALRAGAARATTSASRRSSTRRAENEAKVLELAARARRGDGLRRHARLRAALPALDRPAAQGRAADRALPAGRRRLRATSSPIPGKPFGFGKLIRAQAAGDFESLRGARPPRRAHPTGGGRRCSSG